MRKIITVNNVNFTFDFLEEEFVDHLNSKISIDILVEKLESEMNGPNMWHFVHVLKTILFDRGEKAAELILIEVRSFIQYVIFNSKNEVKKCKP